MAPFIKFTEKSQSPTGQSKQFRFINASHILNAWYIEEARELKIILTSKPDSVAFTLQGDEADEALKILQSL